MGGSTLALAKTALRAFIVDGVPSSGACDPSKTDLINVFGDADNRLTTLESGVVGASVVEPSWAALSSIAGAYNGASAQVYGDAGTHTDPVTTLTVANTGTYSWVAASGHWQWVSPYTPAITQQLAVVSVPQAGELSAEVSAGAAIFVQNGAVAVYDASGQNPIGIVYPAGVTGAYSYLFNFPLIAPPQIAALAGATIRITAVYNVTTGFLAAKGPMNTASGVQINGASGSAVGTFISASQSGNYLTIVGEYTVVGTETSIGAIFQPTAMATVGAAHSAQISSVTWAVVADAPQSSLGAGGRTLANAISTQAAARSGSGSILEEMPTANASFANTVTGLYDAATGNVNGWTIPAGDNGGFSYLQFYYKFFSEDALYLQGRTLRVTLLLSTSANYAHPITPNVYVDTPSTMALAANIVIVRNVQIGTNARVITVQFDTPSAANAIRVNIINGNGLGAGFTTSGTADSLLVSDVALEVYASVSGVLTTADETKRLQANKAARAALYRALGSPAAVQPTKKTVKSSGGDYASITAAFSGTGCVAPGTEVVVSGESYADGNWTPYFGQIDIRGAGPRRTQLAFANANNASTATISTFSTLNAKFTNKLRSLRATIQNGRYAAHFESANAYKQVKQVLAHSHLEHLGNAGAYAYQVGLGGSGNPGAVWTSPAALGVGSSDGSELLVENCSLIGYQFEAFTGHCWNNAAAPCKITFKHVRFVPQSTSHGSLIWYTTGSRQHDALEFVGCQFNGAITFGVSAWQSTAAADQIANKMEYTVYGHGNTPTAYVYLPDGSAALRIDSATTGAGSSVVISGTAAAVLFGSAAVFGQGPVTIAGVAGLAGAVYGVADVGEHLVGPAGNVNVTSLGYRLGDCSVTNLTLTVTIDGGAPINILFNANYTAATNATIIAQINTALGAHGVCSTFDVGSLWRPMFYDEELTLVSSAATTIKAGMALKFDGTQMGCQIMTSTDAASLFAGIAYETITPGGYGRVKKAGVVRVSQDLLRSDSGTFAQGATFGVGATPGLWTLSPSIPLLVAINPAEVKRI